MSNNTSSFCYCAFLGLIALVFVYAGNAASEQKNWLKESDLSLLKSNDIFDIRRGVQNISMYKTNDSLKFLTGLWNNNNFTDENINMAIISQPIVKLKVAQLLAWNDKKNPVYFNYVKNYVNSDDLAVRTVAAEALRDIYSPKALDMLRALASSNDEMIADIALSGIKHQTIFGSNRGLAKAIWAELNKSNTTNKALILKYDRMYDEHNRNKTKQ